MSPRTLNIAYWTLTVIFCGLMLLSSTGGFLQDDESRAVMARLGYPMQLLLILSIGKVLAVIALVQQRWHTIKEWAYAGLTYDFVCAAIAWIGVNEMGFALFMLVPQGLLVAHYVLWKRRLQAA